MYLHKYWYFLSTYDTLWLIEKIDLSSPPKKIEGQEMP
jgi:hypothetical protein